MADPRIYTDAETIETGSNLTLTFKGEQYSGNPILDTKVEIEGGTLLWITWADKDKFISEFKDLLDKYAI